MGNKGTAKSLESADTRKMMLRGLTIIVAVLVIAYLCISQYYKDHFYSQTFINGLDCSNLTAQEAKERITSHVKSYILTIVERDGTRETISAKDIGLTCSFDQDIGSVLDEQSAYFWPFNTWKDNEVENPCTLSYDQEKFEQIIDSLSCLDSEKQIDPTNATISEYSVDNGFVIIPESEGSKVLKKQLVKAITESIYGLRTELSLEEASCYKEPEVRSSNPILESAINTMHQYMQTKLTYTFGDKTEVFDGTDIGPALSVNDNYEVVIDENKVKEFVDYLKDTYDTMYTTRHFTTTYGKTVTLSQGDYGWSIKASDELKEIIECIKSGEQKEKEPVYLQKAAQYGEDDIGDTYVEINLSAQHLFFIKDGERVFETDFVSGCVAEGNETPSGVYGITYKRKNAVLKGQGYNTPVTYWMPFNGGIGMHDAYWRDIFGGDRFIYNGSHGCINLPTAAAKRMYEYVDTGTPVICYRLEGTESYSVAKYNRAKN